MPVSANKTAATDPSGARGVSASSQPTLADVAKRAGVSMMTVSRALRPGRPVHARTRDRVLAAASQLGYRINVAAQATATGRFGSISLLLSTKRGRSALPELMLRGIHEALVKSDLRLQVSMLPDRDLIDTWGVPTALTQAHADGLLINYTHEIPPELVQRIRANRLPSVWINTRQETDCVHPDDLSAGQAAVERLLALGHRRIAWADFTHGPEFPSPHYSAKDRMDGYLAAMSAAALPPIVLRATSGATVSGKDRHAFARRVLGERDRPTAVICYSSTTAAPFVHAAAQRGLIVPRDLSLISFDDPAPVLLIPMPAIMLVPNAEVGRRAVEMLQRKIANPAEPLAPVAVAYEWLEGDGLAKTVDRPGP